MKTRERFFQIFAAFVLGCAMMSLSLAAIDSAVSHSELQTKPLNCFPQSAPVFPGESFEILDASRAASDPLEMLFRIMFILFFISPPLIVLLLFLIWRELKARNEMK